MTIISHRTPLQPRPKQATWLVEQADYQRWRYNQMVGMYDCGRANGILWDSNTLEKDLRVVRPDWARDRWANGLTMASQQLRRALNAYYSPTNPAGRPRPRRRKDRISCAFPFAVVRVEGRRVRVPKLGWVRMREPVRFDGRLCGLVTVTRRSGRWWVSFTVDTQAEPTPKDGDHVVGVDVGLLHLAVTSDGQVFETRARSPTHCRSCAA